MIEKYQGLIRNVVYGIVGSTMPKADVDDIVQDVNVKLISGVLDQFDPERGEIATFIHTVTKNLTIDTLRGRRNMYSFDNTDEHGDPIGIDPEFTAGSGLDALELLVRAEQESRLISAMEALEPRDKQFLRVVMADGFNTEAYAEKAGISPVAVRVRKSRIADKLRALIRQLDDES